MKANWHTAEVCNVAGALTDQAGQCPDVPAIHYPTGVKSGVVSYRSASYRELDDLSNGYAHGLHAAGIRRGTRAALMVPPGLDFVAMFFGLFKAGVVPVLIDPGIGLKSLRHCLAQAAPAAFIGVTRAQLARMALRWARDSIRTRVTFGPRPGWRGISARQLLQDGMRASGPMLEATRPGEMAAILFTSGSTGIPKGVVYRHRHFAHQIDMLRQAFGIEAGETDLATFPPFALFDPALGMSTVIPWMDPTRPASANPEYLVQAIERFNVTSIFGSPALLNVLSRHTEARGMHLDGVKRVIAAGAALPVATLLRMQNALVGEAAVHTGYGATECLPVASLSSHDLGANEEQLTLGGAGICIGRAVAPNRVAIMAITDKVVERLEQSVLLPPGQCGEIVVHGPTATDAYWRRDEQTRLAKTTDAQGRLWHRMGDIGYIDEQGRLWYCGRKSQRVQTATGNLFPDQVEAVFNAHPEVDRTALVGVGAAGRQSAVLIVETASRDRDAIKHALLRMASEHDSMAGLETVLFHPGFPVDIRHNSKINREELSAWAAGQLQ